MAKKANVAPRDSRWFQRILSGKQARDRMRPQWRNNLALLLGPPGNSGGTGNQNTDVYLAWAAFQTVIGLVHAQNSSVVIKQTKEALTPVAQLLTAAVQQDADNMRLQAATHAVMQDVWWAGHGFLYEKLSNDDSSPSAKYLEEGGEYNVKQTYQCYRIHPEMILVDPTAAEADFYDAKWIALKYYPTVKELRQSEYYQVPDDVLKALPRLTVAPMLSPDSALPSYAQPYGEQASPKNEDPELAQVACWEVLDRVNGQRLYVPDYCDYVIGQGPWPVDLRFNGERRFPVTPMCFSPHPERFYGVPEMTMVAPQIAQFQLLFKHLIRDAVTKWRKFASLGLDDNEIAKIVSSTPNAVVKFSTKTANLQDLDVRKMIVPLPDVQVKQDVVAVMNIVKSLVHEILGASDFASAGFRSTRSATEAAALSDFLKVRSSPRTKAVDTYYRDFAITHTLMLQKTAVQPRGVELEDPNGQTKWQMFTATDIQGEFLFRVIAGSSSPTNTESAKQEAISFYNLTAPLVVQNGGTMEPLVRWIADFVRMPQHMVDQIFSGHKQALVQMAQLYAKIHLGQVDLKVASQAILESMATVVQTGLNSGELAAVQQSVQQEAGGQAPQKAMPEGVAGTNETDQTLPS